MKIIGQLIHKINNIGVSYFVCSCRARVTNMSRKRKDSSPMPAASAGLLRFFEEETEGIKIRPELLVVFAIIVIIGSVLANMFFIV
jgi:preprotein translocase subunit Sec61beta